MQHQPRGIPSIHQVCILRHSLVLGACRHPTCLTASPPLTLPSPYSPLPKPCPRIYVGRFSFKTLPSSASPFLRDPPRPCPTFTRFPAITHVRWSCVVDRNAPRGPAAIQTTSGQLAGI
ncbi:hypothetical protein E2C01_038579 [Portunus trituberculatus]|uniref:Uncharacterized protein n=1 Tax=Portunus trituberculatus TaxID=210409 RepID=A0A5B7FIX1_PORTR|nr:hypothetical protein [Portunus trituberculatus]